MIVSLIASASLLAIAELKGVKFMTIKSGSMGPKLHKSDLVVVTPLVDWPRVGEIVSFSSRVTSGELVTHRVERVDTVHGYIVTKGDNLELTDPPLRRQQIIGKVVWHSSIAGQVEEKLRQPMGLVIAIYLPGIVIIVLELKRLLRRRSGHQHYSLLASRR